MKGLRFTVALALAILAGACAVERGPKHWSYEGETGPEHWSSLKPEYSLASTGDRQSPIDIQDARPGRVEPMQFHYHPTVLRLENDGRTVRMIYDEGSYLLLGSERYELRHIEFHSPSEHTFGGRHWAIEAQIIHESATGQLAVISVFAGKGMGNRLLAGFFPHIPGAREATTLEDVSLNALDLLPDDRTRYSYTGSLTAPPCTEGVRWIVMKKPIAASIGQVDRLRFFTKGNNRPVQPLNGRVVTIGE